MFYDKPSFVDNTKQHFLKPSLCFLYIEKKQQKILQINVKIKNIWLSLGLTFDWANVYINYTSIQRYHLLIFSL